MNKMKKIVLLAILLAINVLYATAQQVLPEENTGVMRSNGKIYVVIVVVVTILTGLFLYVFALDRKISKLEKK